MVLLLKCRHDLGDETLELRLLALEAHAGVDPEGIFVIAQRRFQHYIDGEFSDGEACYPSIDPDSGAIWAEMPEAREGDVDRA
ncbi:hypothetical protein AB9F35_35030, partial [Rhizobium leguminosarum]|uniref:hypothetical protein n=1 Tax=Rhizobium leguminosarum TaxID=384 RepID=UPI003F97B4CD